MQLAFLEYFTHFNVQLPLPSYMPNYFQTCMHHMQISSGTDRWFSMSRGKHKAGAHQHSHLVHNLFQQCQYSVLLYCFNANHINVNIHCEMASAPFLIGDCQEARQMDRHKPDKLSQGC